MKTIKFKIISTQGIQNEVLGYEWVANGRWYHQFKDQTTNEGPALGTYERAQFTGLTDKNGQDLYEGDIVITMESVLKISFDGENGAFVLCRDGFKPMFLSQVSDIKIIGSIYENPELLK